MLDNPSRYSSRRTTLAVRAVTSRSEDRAVRVTLTEARREGVRRDTSRRHSVAKARNIDRLMSKDLHISNINNVEITTLEAAHALARVFPV